LTLPQAAYKRVAQALLLPLLLCCSNSVQCAVGCVLLLL
jgi:hypothetical protein